MTIPQDLTLKLRRIANEIRPLEQQGFFSVIKAAEDIGARVELHLHSLGNRCDALIDLDGSFPRIILFRHSQATGRRLLSSLDEHLITARERFSIAHELGHWFAYQQFKLRPARDGGEYWKQEACMNEFASALLVPNWLVRVWLTAIPEGELISPLSVRHWAREQCRVSEEVVATALCRERRGIGFIKTSLTTERKSGGLILKTLFSVQGEGLSLPRLHSHIKNDELIRALESKKLGMRAFQNFQLAQRKPQDLKIAWRRVGSLPETSNKNRDSKVSGKNEVFWLAIAIR